MAPSPAQISQTSEPVRILFLFLFFFSLSLYGIIHITHLIFQDDVLGRGNRKDSIGGNDFVMSFGRCRQPLR